MQLTGIHHLTAISADAPGNHAFYTQVLGMRLVKKTVNQDDTSAYHLFYGDGRASPGSDITFFEWAVPREERGTHAITRTALRVTGRAALEYWVSRFDEHNVDHSGIITRDGRESLDFEDPEGQRLSLIDDGGAGAGEIWEKSPVPAQFQIRGLGPITLSVPDPAPTDLVLTQVLEMRPVRAFEENGRKVQVYEMGEGGPDAEVQVVAEPDLPPARQGAGAVHHIAFRTPDRAQYEAWAQRLASIRLPSSGPVDRHYFRSLYFREPNGILIEIATDGPGFDVDEPMETLGESLALPPFLEERRAQIEAGLKTL